MKIKGFFIAIAISLVAASCAKEINDRSKDGLVPMEVSVISEQPKAYLDGSSTLWSENDAIAVFDGCDKTHKFTLNSGAGTTAGIFKGSVCVDASNFYAASPYSDDIEFNDGEFTMTLPYKQSIDLAKGSDPKALLSVGIIENNELKLKNVGAVVRFSISAEDVSKVVFEGNDNEEIAGEVTVNSAGVIIGDTIVEGKEQIELTPSDGDVFAPGTYEIVILPTDFESGIKLTLTVSAASPVVKSSPNKLTLVRNAIINLGDICNGFGLEIPDGAYNNAISCTPGGMTSVDIKDSGVSGIVVEKVPKGWSAEVNGNKLEITAPSDGDRDLEGIIVLKGMKEGTKSSVVKSLPAKVRLCGINSKADLLAFRAAHGGTENQHNEQIADPVKYAASIAPFMVGEWITLNADIEAIKGGEFTNSYTNFMHHIHEKIDGQNHTINLDVTGQNTVAILSFFQHIDASLKNLNFAGQMTQTAFDACVFATLAQQVSTAGVTIENVNSSVKLTTSKKDCAIGGLISQTYQGCETNIKKCTYSGTIEVSAQQSCIGGILGCNKAGTGAYLVTIEDCIFSGEVNYSATDHYKDSRFGGIMGDQGRNGIIENCVNNGTMTFNLQNAVIAGSNTSGIGGIVGRCNATAEGYTMHTVVKNCSFLGDIVFNAANPSQSTEFIKKIVGTPLSGYDTAASTENVDTGTITYNYSDPVGTITFKDATDLSFAYGETKSIAITTSRMTSLEAVVAPKGWTIDFTNWNNGSISVTAPASGEGAIDGAIELSLRGKDDTYETAYSSNTKYIRLYGINNVDELAAFTTAYGNGIDNPTTSGPTIEPYLVDGEITFNTDVTIPAAQISSRAYWLKKLNLPLNGNKHTVTYAVTREHRGGLFQDISCNVHDLNLAGTITASAPTSAGQFGALACANVKSGTVIRNVNSKVTISFSNSNGQTLILGGLIGNSNAGLNISFVNCTVSGKITLSGIANNSYVGGILGSYGADGKTAVGTYYRKFENCTHSGAIEAEMSAGCDFRLGGFVGNSERSIYLTGCTNSGDVTIDCDGIAYSNGSSCGLGGIIGRQGAQVKDYDMTCKITDCINSGKISLLNAVKNDYNVESNGTAGCVGQFVGKNHNYGKTYSEEGTCTKSGSVVITYVK